MNEHSSASVPLEGRRPSRIDAELERLRAPRPAGSPAGPLTGLLLRARDMVVAKLSDLLDDRPDDPARTIRQMIGEMEQALGEVRASAARTIADRKELERHRGRLVRLQEDWTGKAQLALSRGREDLARAALVEKRKAAGLAEQLAGEIAELDGAVRAYEDDLARLQQRLGEARGRQAVIAARLDSAEQRIKLGGLLAGERIDEAMARFGELERRVDEAEGEAEALGLAAGESGRRPAGLAGDIAALEASAEIDSEIAALRRSMPAPPEPAAGSDKEG